MAAGGPLRPFGEGAPASDAGGESWVGSVGGWQRRGYRRVPGAGAITYLLRSGWGERGMKWGGTVMAFHPRLENPLGGRRTHLQPNGIGNSERLQGGWGMAKKIRSCSLA